MNLEEKVQHWHADATLPSTLRTRLRQAVPPSKCHRPTLALCYGLAACIGVGLGVGVVSYKNRSHREQPLMLSQETKTEKPPSNETFQKVANTIKFWREPDEQAAKKKQRYEAILFTDLDCASCKKAYPLLKKATSLRLGICQMPLTKIHPEALGKAVEAEAYQDAVGFWNYMDRAHSQSPTRAWEQNLQVQYNFVATLARKKTAEQRVAAMRAVAQSAGVTEVPTLWIRSGNSFRMVARGVRSIKIVLETLP